MVSEIKLVTQAPEHKARHEVHMSSHYLVVSLKH